VNDLFAAADFAGRASSADFIQKPYTPDSLARKVRDVLDARQRRAVVAH